MIAKNFTTHEAIYSETAKEHGYDNIPKYFETVQNILYTAMCMQELRDKILKAPVIVTSWYRHIIVNELIGGVDDSQHIEGKAVDFICPAFGTCKEIYEAIKHSDIIFDQLILEKKIKRKKPVYWIHISFNAGKDRRETIDFS